MMKAEEEKWRWTEGTDLGQTSVESKMPIANAQGYKAEKGVYKSEAHLWKVGGELYICWSLSDK